MNKLLTVVYVLSNVADFCFTVYGILATSLEMEANPLARSILIDNGIVGLFIYKFGGVLFVLMILILLARIGRVCAWIRYAVPALLLLGIVISMRGVWSWLPVLQAGGIR